MMSFNTHDAVKQLIGSSVKEKQAEEFVKIFSQVKEIDFNKVASKEQIILLKKDIENISKNSATKADLEKLRTEMHQDEKRLEKKSINLKEGLS